MKNPVSPFIKNHMMVRASENLRIVASGKLDLSSNAIIDNNLVGRASLEYKDTRNDGSGTDGSDDQGGQESPE